MEKVTDTTVDAAFITANKIELSVDKLKVDFEKWGVKPEQIINGEVTNSIYQLIVEKVKERLEQSLTDLKNHFGELEVEED